MALSKLLNRHLEKSFYDLLNEIRIKRAQQQLADPKLKIGDIESASAIAIRAFCADV
jgi:YesN/AraC family two-component response regulator